MVDLIQNASVTPDLGIKSGTNRVKPSWPPETFRANFLARHDPDHCCSGWQASMRLMLPRFYGELYARPQNDLWPKWESVSSIDSVALGGDCIDSLEAGNPEQIYSKQDDAVTMR
jgi:hypothetical protein